MMGGMGYGAAAQFVGGLMQAAAASRAQKKMDREFRKELERQRGLGREALGAYGPSLEQAGRATADTQMAAGKAQREADYSRVNATPYTFGNPAFQATGADSKYGALMGGLRGQVGSYSDWQQQQGLRAQALNNELGRITNFARGWQDVFPARMYDAQHSADELAFWGQLISSLGGGASNFASLMGSQPPQGGMGGYGAGMANGFSLMPSFDDAYGNTWDAGWNTMGGAGVGAVIPG